MVWADSSMLGVNHFIKLRSTKGFSKMSFIKGFGIIGIIGFDNRIDNSAGLFCYWALIIEWR